MSQSPQYKAIFLGTVDPHSELSKLKRAFNSQKCIRAGGKHNGSLLISAPATPLIHVVKISKMSGKTLTIILSSRCWVIGHLGIISRLVKRELRFFLLKNVQKEAIAYSWELLTEVYKLPKEQLYVTYFEGDSKTRLDPDLEAKEYWLAQGVLEDHILPGNAKDNFWGALCFILLTCLIHSQRWVPLDHAGLAGWRGTNYFAILHLITL